jgi:RNA methyltransferase, TrmH family
MQHEWTNIVSRDNQHLKLARAARERKADGLIFVEGKRLVGELLRSGLRIRSLLASTSFLSGDPIGELEGDMDGPIDRHVVSDSIFQQIADTRNPQGILALADEPDPRQGLETFFASEKNEALMVVLGEAADPSNVGAVIRTAEAAGAIAVLLTVGSADPFSPRALRASMGSAFRMPIGAGFDAREIIDQCRVASFTTYGAVLNDGSAHDKITWAGRRALFIGSEASGLSSEVVRAIDQKVGIEMDGSVESLNLAVSAGILMFESRRSVAATRLRSES